MIILKRNYTVISCVFNGSYSILGYITQHATYLFSGIFCGFPISSRLFNRINISLNMYIRWGTSYTRPSSLVPDPTVPRASRNASIERTYKYIPIGSSRDWTVAEEPRSTPHLPNLSSTRTYFSGNHASRGRHLLPALPSLNTYKRIFKKSASNQIN